MNVSCFGWALRRDGETTGGVLTGQSQSASLPDVDGLEDMSPCHSEWKPVQRGDNFLRLAHLEVIPNTIHVKDTRPALAAAAACSVTDCKACTTPWPRLAALDLVQTTEAAASRHDTAWLPVGVGFSGCRSAAMPADGLTKKRSSALAAPKRGRESEETGTESEMTEGTEETINDLEEALAKRTRRGVPRKPRAPIKRPPPAYSVESGFAIRAEKVAACSCKRIIIGSRMGKSLKGCRQGSRFAAS